MNRKLVEQMFIDLYSELDIEPELWDRGRWVRVIDRVLGGLHSSLKDLPHRYPLGQLIESAKAGGIAVDMSKVPLGQFTDETWTCPWFSFEGRRNRIYAELVTTARDSRGFCDLYSALYRRSDLW